MIKKFIDRLLGKGQKGEPAPPAIPLGVRVEVPVEQHGIDPKLLDDNAVRVVKTLKDAGHEAYIVGGAVRDLLVGLRPKDFDVATDATPEQVKALFRRAFIIGRRFRLVHVVFGRGREHEVIEVSTFRAYLDAAAADQVVGNEKTAKREIAEKTHVVDAAGRVLRDNAVRVVKTLKDAGHEAYIVGGAVRDLLVGLRPKDFDVATDATPEQVKALFRRAFIIGRRFRLVHVVFGRGREHEVIEVSTFRAYLDAAAADQVVGNEKTAKREIAEKTHVVDAAGRVLRDNVWGPQIEDAARRDFTINAMYYDPTTQTVVDYHGGLADVRAKRLRMIGDPETRYREDPVRIVRVVRFAAKLGFEIDPATRKPIRAMAALLANVPQSRLFDEMIKLLQTGHSLASIAELKKQGLERGVFPVLDAVLHPETPHPARERFVRLALDDTDRRVADGRSVVPSFMLACMLWHDVLGRWNALRDAGEAPFPALQQAIDAVFDARIGDISGRGKLAADMREVWQMQPRFERRTASTAHSLVEQPRFRAGYDFLRLRADVGEVDPELADWWEDYHLGDDDEREALLQDVKTRSAPVRRRGPAAAAPPVASPDAPAAEQPSVAPDADAPARKKRRRRRRPAAGATPATE